ncbi:MAG: DUF2892 domain-containing protein [Candidatus Gracilibacteria bacterium]|nr:DUF2892 domain-containing protein [Candidatus Gracilibacteria bacterium]MDD2908440.1 DUF2892 domain-containing protein [Candidatus Gracilibacteria bacterium]
MHKFKNEGGLDRLIRINLSLILFILGFFWVGGIIQIILLILSAILFITGIVGFCGLYKLIGITTLKKDEKISKLYWIIFTALFIIISIAGSYYSIFFTKKFFIEDYNKMNKYYKQTLFDTGKEKRAESISNYNSLIKEYKIFLDKYTTYHPYSLSTDKNLNSDLENQFIVINSLKEKVNTGNLKEAHLSFEKIRPIFQDILKRNGFSMLAVSLVDFHDVMENVIEAADSKDSKGVINSYTEADIKLKAVEEVANDLEIQTIRKNLDEVKNLAEQNKIDTISAKAAELKSSFVKVYLKRG